MYLATYSISLVLNLKSVLWKLQFEVMLCYRNNSQRRAVEIHKLKESQYSSYSAVFAACWWKLHSLMSYQVQGMLLSELSQWEALKSVICLVTLIVALWWLLLECFWHISMKDSWNLSDTKYIYIFGTKMESWLIVKSWTHISFLSQELLSIALGNCLNCWSNCQKHLGNLRVYINLQNSHFKNSLPFINSHGTCKKAIGFIHWVVRLLWSLNV